jgi:hypothetical protein
MTRMAGSMRMSLAVGLLGRTGTGQTSLNTHLTRVTHTGVRTGTELAGHITAGQR